MVFIGTDLSEENGIESKDSFFLSGCDSCIEHKRSNLHGIVVLFVVVISCVMLLAIMVREFAIETSSTI